jgi:hypothetical protein
MLQPSQNRADRIAELLANTPTDTVYIPLSKLKRRPLKPLYQLNRSKSTPIHEDALSVGSFESLESDFSLHSIGEHSLRVRIRRMEEKIKDQENGQEEAEPIPLPPEMFSWNKRIPKKIPKGSHPPVNIIGCHQPAELIFARADERIRKQLHAKELKEKHLEDLVKYLDHLIQMKLTRGERYAAQLEQQQRHSFWMKTISILRYASLIFPIIQSSKAVKKQQRKVSKAAIMIQTRMISWYERRVLMRYANFVSQMVDVIWKFRLQVAIFQKRRASRIIRIHLQEKRENREMAQLVHAFLAGVRRIQNLARAFIACKVSRIRALATLWEDIETQYLQVEFFFLVVKALSDFPLSPNQTVLASRRNEMNNQSSRSMKHLVIDEKTRSKPFHLLLHDLPKNRNG